MSRYYFHVKDGSTTLDADGVELHSLQAARNMAIESSGEVLKDGASEALWGGECWVMWVTDEPNGAGHTFFTLRFSAESAESAPA
jgi:hypothetical protein